MSYIYLLGLISFTPSFDPAWLVLSHLPEWFGVRHLPGQLESPVCFGGLDIPLSLSWEHLLVTWLNLEFLLVPLDLLLTVWHRDCVLLVVLLTIALTFLCHS